MKKLHRERMLKKIKIIVKKDPETMTKDELLEAENLLLGYMIPELTPKLKLIFMLLTEVQRELTLREERC